ncbi:MAG: zf-HC2 domain-containing protein, partial [Kofleriaceae bacterium]
MTEPRMGSCDPLHAYVDGELDADETTAFEAHLVTCDACNDELPRLLALMTALDAAAAHQAAMPSGTQRLAVLPGGRETHAPGPRPAREPSHRRRRAPWIGACLVAAAAAVAVVVLRPHPAPVVASIDRELGARRTIDVRLS